MKDEKRKHAAQNRPRLFRSRRLCLSWLAALFLANTASTLAATVDVRVGGTGPEFTPSSVFIQPGDTVQWTWAQTPPHGASVTSGESGQHNGLFDSGVHTTGHKFSYTFTSVGRFDYFCRVEPSTMTGVVIVLGARPLNISTRLRVQTGENVLIGGFIITGSALKKVIVRAIGPSLQQAGLSNVLPDPVLELRGSDGSLIRNNDNWKDTQRSDIESTGIPPQNDLEAALTAHLVPGSYTAIVSGKNATTGLGLVEVYDLTQPSDASLANISTRGFVQTGSDVMIGGFILSNSTAGARVIVRAIGPSLTAAGISGALADPGLELRDSNGGLVRSNNNWKESQQTEIQNTGIPPKHDLESALVTELSSGSYTAIVSGNGGATGVGLVEVYHLQ